MKVMLFLFLFFLGEVNASPRKVHPLSASALRYKSYQYDISTRYSKTLSYFDVDSNEVALNESFNYSLMDFDLGISYGFRENFTVGLDGKFRQVTSENSLETLTTSGIESIGVSFK